MKVIKNDGLRFPWWFYTYDDSMPYLDPSYTGVREIHIANVRGIYLR